MNPIASEAVARMWIDAHRHLLRTPGPLATLVASHGLIARAPQVDRVRALVWAIVGQQLSTRAAATIRSRLDERLGPGPLATALEAVSDAALLTCGLSNAKVRSVRDLESRVRDGTLAPEQFDRMPDDEIRRVLVVVRGIGPWTAEMFLMFSMCRPDVLATTDLGIQVAVGKMTGLARKATPEEVRQAAKVGQWHPFASAACLHLWRSLDGPAGMVS